MKSRFYSEFINCIQYIHIFIKRVNMKRFSIKFCKYIVNNIVLFFDDHFQDHIKKKTALGNTRVPSLDLSSHFHV